MMQILFEIVLEIFYYEQTWLIYIVSVKCMVSCAFSNFIKRLEVLKYINPGFIFSWPNSFEFGKLVPISVTGMEIMRAANVFQMIVA